MGRRKSRKENGRHACALGARWREAGVSRLRAEVLRNFLSVNRGIKEGAGASRPVLARVGRLRAAVSLAVPALVSQGLPEACPRPLSGWGGAYTGSEPSTPEPRPCFPSVGSPGGRNLQVGLGEEDVRAGGRTASWHSSCGGAQVTDSWATWRAAFSGWFGLGILHVPDTPTTSPSKPEGPQLSSSVLSVMNILLFSIPDFKNERLLGKTPTERGL